MKRLVLFNGGLKSTFLAELAKREGEVVLCYCTLDPKGFRRLDKITKLAAILGLPLLIHKLVQAPVCKEVLLRMLFLVLHVLPIAKEQQCKCIYHGLSIDDDPRVVPVLDAFVKQLGALIELGQPLYNGKGIWLGNVTIETPLRRLDRARVIRLGNEWNVPWALTHSCSFYSGFHCGMCLNCLQRKRAFKLEGHDDPTTYQIY